MNTIILLSFFALVTAINHIHADETNQRSLTYFFKPATTILIFLIAFTANNITPSPATTFYRNAILLGLLFSLAGDIFLMLKNDYFIHGLVSFLIAHLFYIAAFTSAAALPPSPTTIFILIPLLIYAAYIFSQLWPHLKPDLQIPVIIYMWAILFMAWQAGNAWLAPTFTINLPLTNFYPSQLSAFVGALFFVISDSALALNRFRAPFPRAQRLVLSTYYFAQWLIALSLL
ncbi:MAG TPA: lysoplasmalogenase [Anaerolineae bacterium]|nr:lysoplasmalogenase [Anaerolineae bacterium]